MTAENGRVRISILGSTGSVGRQALEVIDELPDRFQIVALAAGSNQRLLVEQAERYQPSLVAAKEPLAQPPVCAVALGDAGLLAAATHPEADIVLVATSGHAAIRPTFAAIAAGKTIALANKETIVCAGELIMPHARKHGVEIRPVDSEHSAIWQCLGTSPSNPVSRLIVTGSGGPFRTTSKEDLESVTVRDALAHPTWSMGNKITIDSATLMNKGLEIIEARWLFDVPYERIDLLIHPESIVHSLVEFDDGSVLAQLGLPDMKLPIQYALTAPGRAKSPWPRLSLADISALHFERPDSNRFPSLLLARRAGVSGGTYPTVLSAADDVAVEAFLTGRLRFVEIPTVIETVLDLHHSTSELTLEAIAEADHWARSTASALIRERFG